MSLSNSQKDRKQNEAVNQRKLTFKSSKSFLFLGILPFNCSEIVYPQYCLFRKIKYRLNPIQKEDSTRVVNYQLCCLFIDLRNKSLSRTKILIKLFRKNIKAQVTKDRVRKTVQNQETSNRFFYAHQVKKILIRKIQCHI